MNEDIICWILNLIQHEDLLSWEVEKLATEIDKLKARITELENVASEVTDNAFRCSQYPENCEIRFKFIEKLEMIRRKKLKD